MNYNNNIWFINCKDKHELLTQMKKQGIDKINYQDLKQQIESTTKWQPRLTWNEYKYWEQSKKMKNRKVSSIDDISNEMLMYGREIVVNDITQRFNKICQTGITKLENKYQSQNIQKREKKIYRNNFTKHCF